MKFFFSIFLACFFLHGSAQVSNTKWQGSVELDTLTKVILHFGKDTITVTNASNGELIETITFAQKGNVMLLQKVSGKLDDCDKRDIGVYKFDVRTDGLFFQLMEDDCNTRSGILEGVKWDAVKDEE